MVMQRSAKPYNAGSNPVFASNIDSIDSMFGSIFVAANRAPNRKFFELHVVTSTGIGFDPSLFTMSKIGDELE